MDEILPIKPVRQFVLSFPIQIRLLLAVRPKVMAEIHRITIREISKHLAKKADVKKSKAGAVTLIQRFGGSINLNVHFHMLFLDGVYELDDEKKPGQFHITKAPTHVELAQVLEKIILKTTKYLEKRGLIRRDEEDNVQLNIDEDDALAKLQAGAATYRFVLGPNKGKKALTLKTVDEDHTTSRGLVAQHSGFSLHAGVAFTGTERKKIEKLARYIARPAVALERLSLNGRGQVIYQLKKPYSDGTTAISMTQMELLERLAAIVPRPRVHLTRFSGVFAPHYKFRDQVVLKSNATVEPEGGNGDMASKSRISWAQLLKRVFDIDVSLCQICGKETKIIASIEDPAIIKKILGHLGLPYPAPTPWPARGPPNTTDDFIQQHQFDFT